MNDLCTNCKYAKMECEELSYYGTNLTRKEWTVAGCKANCMDRIYENADGEMQCDHYKFVMRSL